MIGSGSPAGTKQAYGETDSESRNKALARRFRIWQLSVMTGPQRRSWSRSFRAYVAGQKLSQRDVAAALGVAPSAVHYWLRGAVPREATRAAVATWSGGAVDVARADVPQQGAA